MIGDYAQAFFLHIPKTAGESFGHLLRHDAGLGEVLRLPPDEGFFPALVTADRYAVVHGHAPYPVAGVLGDPLLVMTFLRAPVARVISQFEYVQRSDHPQHQKQREALRERGIETIEDLVASGRASNNQTLMLGADADISALVERFRHDELSATQARTELQRIGHGRGGQPTLARAKSRLEQIQFVGITEAFDESVRLFANLIGMSSPPDSHRTNIAPRRERAARKRRYTATTLAAIADANRLDLELYEFAVELFKRRHEEAFGEAPAIETPEVAATAASGGSRTLHNVRSGTDPHGTRRRRMPAERRQARGRPGWSGAMGDHAQGFFLHIPKTAGMSFQRLLRDTGPGQILRLPPDDGFFPALVTAERYPLVHGHAPYPVAAALQEPLFSMTFLRSPLDRALSGFEFLWRGDHPLHEAKRRRWRDTGLETVADVVGSGRFSHNDQTRFLGAAYDIAPLVDRFRSGELSAKQARREMQRANRQHADRETLERAKARLERIQFVGITEGFDESIRLFANLLGMSSVPAAPRTNAAPRSERTARGDRYDQPTLTAIANANRLDLELYDFAIELFRKRYEHAFGEAPSIAEPEVFVADISANSLHAQPTRQAADPEHQPQIAPRRELATVPEQTGSEDHRSTALAGHPQALFLHIPKTAGVSFQGVLRGAVGAASMRVLPHGPRMVPALLAPKDETVLHGHVPYAVRDLLRQPVFLMTLLRQPVDRVISGYEYIQRNRGVQPLVTTTYERWQRRGIDGPAQTAANLQTALLGADCHLVDILARLRRRDIEAATASSFVREQIYGPRDRRTLERAKERLDQMQFVGITEAFDESVRLFASLIDVTSPTEAPLTNAAPPSERAARRDRYDEATLEAIAEANQLDLELYDFAVELFKKRYEGAFGEAPAIASPGFTAVSGSSNGAGSRSSSRRRTARTSGKNLAGPGKARRAKSGDRRRSGDLGDYAQAFFLHIPKTAGMSFGRLLRRETDLGKVLRVGSGDEIFPTLASADGYPVVQGHVPYPVAGILRQPLFILTFLRQPLDRAISLFEYYMRTDQPLFARWRDKGLAAPVDLIERGIARNRQTKLLGTDFDLAPVLERFKLNELSAGEARRELQRLMPDPDSDALERAKERLERIQFVGITEAFDDSTRLFGKLIGMQSSPAPYRMNIAPAGDQGARRARYDETTLEAIAEANRLDLELYDFARALFERRYEEAFGKAPDLNPPSKSDTPAR